MKRSGNIRFGAMLLTLSVLGGCYEGFDGPGGSQSGDQPPASGAPQEKPLYYVLLQLIRLNAGGIADRRCFPSSALAEYKKTEWETREGALLEAVSGAAEKTSAKSISVGAVDCGTLRTVESAALAQNPWNEGVAPDEDPKGRPVVDLKVVFWDEQPGITPSKAVASEHWAAAEDLVAKGRKVVSLAYFVLSRSGAGYFQDWKKALPGPIQFSGTGLDQVDPTAAGIAARQETIAKDTAAVMAWVLERGR